MVRVRMWVRSQAQMSMYNNKSPYFIAFLQYMAALIAPKSHTTACSSCDWPPFATSDIMQLLTWQDGTDTVGDWEGRLLQSEL